MPEARPIVTWVDDPARNAGALREAAALARPMGATLHVAHVLDPAQVARVAIERGQAYREAEAQLAHALQPALQTLGADLRPQARVHLTIRAGEPRSVLFELARSVRAGLLVLPADATAGATARQRAVAAACVRRGPVDVLLLRNRGGAPRRSIAACVGFSGLSRLVLEQASRLAAGADAGLTLVHPFRGSWHDVHYRMPTPATSPEAQARCRADLLAELRRLAEKVLPAELVAKTRLALLDTGEPGGDLASLAASLRPDVLILEALTRRGPLDLLRGTEAERLAQTAPCSVLLVRPPAPAPAAGTSHWLPPAWRPVAPPA